eukprot:5209192-Pleurochrysis_carterae.AAC.2
MLRPHAGYRPRRGRGTGVTTQQPHTRSGTRTKACDHSSLATHESHVRRIRVHARTVRRGGSAS